MFIDATEWHQGGIAIFGSLLLMPENYLNWKISLKYFFLIDYLQALEKCVEDKLNNWDR